MQATKAELDRAGRLSEFVGFFLMAPAAMALFLPPTLMFPMLFSLTAVGLVLLHMTEDFHWRELLVGVDRIDWSFVVLFTLFTFAAGLIVMHTLAPGALWYLLRENPAILLMIALLYPFLSALPQELVFRPLFFRRYSVLLPEGRAKEILLNSGVFAFAHLMYWSWVVAAMTFAGGLIFAWAYRVRGNFAEAVVLHSVAGVVLFALGLGVFFYSGNVQRPF